MEKKIRRLPEAVINQIAAGEVVESPSSIVKELVENSLDAGAERIGIEISNGGHQWIRIEDDGCGMAPEDALLCLERHATSKIETFEDLQKLQTMGFRGEALAAIAAVSHFHLKTSDGNRGTRVMAEGGVISAVEPCARNRGTTIEVRSLFYNVPARKKFQKSIASSTAQITRMVESLALSNPHVAFTFISQGNSVLSVKKESAKERIEEILGKQDIEICFERDQLKIWGFVSAPLHATAKRSGQHFFINRRPIFSPFVSRAVKEGFGTRIAEHLHPPFVLFLEMSPQEVDINVHPQKKEARFKEEGKIFRSFSEAVSRSFEGPHFSEPLSFELPKTTFSFKEESFPWEPPSFSERAAGESYPFGCGQELAARYLSGESPSCKEGVLQIPLPLPSTERFLALYENYLFLEENGILILVNLRRAHSRILLESLEEKKETSQQLIWPLEIDLSREEAAEGEELVEKLSRWGIESRFLGKKRLIVDALPSSLEPDYFPQFFKAWRDGKNLSDSADRFIHMVQKSFSFEEGKAIWKKLKLCRDSLFDPLGNPIWKSLQTGDLERFLKGNKT